jgi:hydrogenase maturation protease
MRYEPATELLVLGLGNVLCGDDGLGIEAVHRLLERYTLAEGVTALDGGTLGMALLGHLAEARRVLLVDAIEADGPPGTLVRLEGEAVAPAVRERLSVHQVGVADLLDSLHLIGAYPPTLVLLGVVPASMDLHLGLSPPVEKAMPALLATVVEELATLGFPVLPGEQRIEPKSVEVTHGRPIAGLAPRSSHHGADHDRL